MLRSEAGATERRGPLQNQKAVAAEMTLVLVRWCQFIQDFSETWGETENLRLLQDRSYSGRGSGQVEGFHDEGPWRHWPGFRSSQLFHTEPTHRIGRPRSPLNSGCQENKRRRDSEKRDHKQVTARDCVGVLPPALHVRLLLHVLPGLVQLQQTHDDRERPLPRHL